MCLLSEIFCPNYLQDILTKVFSLFAHWKSCQNSKLNISQTEFGSSTSDCVLCPLFLLTGAHILLKTLDFPVYSTSFQGPEIVLVRASLPTPLCLSSGPQYLYLGMLQSPLNSSQVFTLVPLIHHTYCYYHFHNLVLHLLTHPTLLKPSPASICWQQWFPMWPLKWNLVQKLQYVN